MYKKTLSARPGRKPCKKDLMNSLHHYKNEMTIAYQSDLTRQGDNTHTHKITFHKECVHLSTGMHLV